MGETGARPSSGVVKAVAAFGNTRGKYGSVGA